MAAPNAWTAVGSLATGRIQPVTVVLQSGEVLVAGGEDANGGTSLASSEIYDPATGTWSAGPDMTRARTGAAAVLLRDGDVLVAGGLTNGLADSTPQTAELYDPFTNTFTATGMMNQRAGGSPDLATSSAQSAVFDPAFAPSAPSAVTAIPGDGSALVTFTAAAPNGAPVTAYTVTASTGQASTLTGGATHTTVTRLTNGTPVTFTVTATNSVGTGPASAPSSAVTPTAAAATPAVTPPAGARQAPDRAVTLRLSGLASRMTLKHFLKGLHFAVTPSKAAALQITLNGTVSRAVISRFDLTLATKRFAMAARTRNVKLVPSPKLVGHPKSAKVEITILAVDAAGTRTTVTRTVMIRAH